MENFVKIILEASLTAGVAVLAVLAVRAVMRKAPKRWAYALWAVVFFRCLCPVSAESGLSVFNIVPDVSEVRQLEELPQMAEQSEIENILPVQTDLNTYGYQTAAPVAEIPAEAFADVTPAEAVPEKKAVKKYAVMFAVWAVGAGAMALYGVVSYVLLMRKLRTAVRTEEGVYESDRISTAFSAGFFPPKIYLPCGLFEQERCLIVAHERVHIKRLDYIVKPVAFLALTVHWFNPLIWAAFALMTRDMELSCDEAVLKIFGAGEKKAYSEALLRVSMKRSGLGDSCGFLPLAFAETGIKGRVKNVLKYKKPTVVVTVIAAAAVAVACVALGTNAKSAADGGEEIEYVEFVRADGVGVNTIFEDVNGNRINIITGYDHLNKENGDLFQRVFAEGDIVPREGYDMPVYIFDLGDDWTKGLFMAVDITELRINDLEIYNNGGKNVLKAEFEFTLAEGADVPIEGSSVRFEGDEKLKSLEVEVGGNVYTVKAEYELAQSGEYGYAFTLNDFWDIPIYVNKELVWRDEIEYVEAFKADGITVNSAFEDVNGNRINIIIGRDRLNKENGDFSQRVFAEGDMILAENLSLPTYDFNIDKDFSQSLFMAVDMTELKINYLGIIKMDGKNVLKAEFEFTLAEGAEVPVEGGSVRFGNDEKLKRLTVEGGGNVYTVKAVYELAQSGEYGYAFALNDFWDIPIYVNKTLLAEGDGYSIVTYPEYERVYGDVGKDGYCQVISGNTDLSLNGYVPAYFACGYAPSSTGVISHSDGGYFSGSGVTGFQDWIVGNEWSFRNSYLGGVSSITVEPAGENSVHILGMKTNGECYAADDVLKFGDFAINEVTLEDMYTETSGGKTRLFTSIKVKAPDEDGLMNLMAVNEGGFEMAVAKLVDDEYLFTVITEYGEEEADSFGVLLEGFTWQGKYVNNKLLFDGWDNVNNDGEESEWEYIVNAEGEEGGWYNVYGAIESAKPEKYYTGKGDKSYRALTLYGDGTFHYIDYTSSAFPLPNPCGEYRREDGSLILTFDDGSELWFDEGHVLGEPLSSILTFNKAASHRADARSLDIPWFGNGEAFELDVEMSEALKAEAEETLKSSFPALSYPARGDISDSYGNGHGHKGIDFSAEKGEEIYAAHDGTVTAVGAGWNGGYGSSVIIDHGRGMETFYAHLSEVSVSEGDEVHKGGVIGYAGSTGDTAYVCLHFEVRIDGRHDDPEKYLGLRHFDAD